MQKILITCMVLFNMLFSAYGTPINQDTGVNVTDTHFTYEFADAETGKQLLLGNTEYHSALTQADIEYKLQKKDATKEEYIEFAGTQVLEFDEEEKEIVINSMDKIEEVIYNQGYNLPEVDNINFVKTTMLEEGNAAAYTHKSDIYLGEAFLDEWINAPEDEKIYYTAVMVHELFHCITRNNPDFRKDMYQIIGFTVAEKDFEISPEIRERMISNPDVGNHDSYASFTINGEEKDCFVIFRVTKEFEKAGDSFFDNGAAHLVPVDNPQVVHTIDEAENFWDVFGENTSYVIDPEECLADNFSYAFLSSEEGFVGINWPNPEILEKISLLLRSEDK